MKQQGNLEHKGKLRESPFGWPLADEQCDDAFCWCKAGVNEAPAYQQSDNHKGSVKNVCGDASCWCYKHWPHEPDRKSPGYDVPWVEDAARYGETIQYKLIEHPRCECHECTQARAGAIQAGADRIRKRAIDRLMERLAPERISENDIYTEIHKIRMEEAPR